MTTTSSTYTSVFVLGLLLGGCHLEYNYSEAQDAPSSPSKPSTYSSPTSIGDSQDDAFQPDSPTNNIPRYPTSAGGFITVTKQETLDLGTKTRVAGFTVDDAGTQYLLLFSERSADLDFFELYQRSKDTSRFQHRCSILNDDRLLGHLAVANGYFAILGITSSIDYATWRRFDLRTCAELSSVFTGLSWLLPANSRLHLFDGIAALVRTGGYDGGNALYLLSENGATIMHKVDTVTIGGKTFPWGVLSTKGLSISKKGILSVYRRDWRFSPYLVWLAHDGSPVGYAEFPVWDFPQLTDVSDIGTHEATLFVMSSAVDRQQATLFSLNIAEFAKTSASNPDEGSFGFQNFPFGKPN